MRTLSILAIIHSLVPTVLSVSGKPPIPINHLLQRTSLTQSYNALRHGQSLANVAKIISSDPKVSTVQHGLSDVGKEQARSAGEAFAEEYTQKSGNDNHYRGVAIFSSDFTRARETASLFADALRNADVPIYSGGVVLERRLRERYFGDLNGGPDTRYQEVWDVDVHDADHEEFNVESANSVLERTTKLITELDDRLQSASEEGGPCWKCILVAHGDVLQIMQTGFLKHEDASMHRSLDHLETASLRGLPLAN